MSLKCRKCRHILVTQHDSLLTAHGEPLGIDADCANVQLAAVFYVQEDHVPAWIGAVVDKVCTTLLWTRLPILSLGFVQGSCFQR
ncbi:hypothetical protein Cfor_06576 [Coptotermes formosanus]|uniref:Uncharacterized protein n=1 Tax=Coptotermes formosanus TaxID=36987 RepID=A0A6L2PEV2_COPFO|nr:hypothetical protein Cfor_06576 [Coptotermes formosanus]